MKKSFPRVRALGELFALGGLIELYRVLDNSKSNNYSYKINSVITKSAIEPETPPYHKPQNDKSLPENLAQPSHHLVTPCKPHLFPSQRVGGDKKNHTAFPQPAGSSTRRGRKKSSSEISERRGKWGAPAAHAKRSLSISPSSLYSRRRMGNLTGATTACTYTHTYTLGEALPPGNPRVIEWETRRVGTV